MNAKLGLFGSWCRRTSWLFVVVSSLLGISTNELDTLVSGKWRFARSSTGSVETSVVLRRIRPGWNRRPSARKGSLLIRCRAEFARSIVRFYVFEHLQNLLSARLSPATTSTGRRTSRSLWIHCAATRMATIVFIRIFDYLLSFPSSGCREPRGNTGGNFGVARKAKAIESEQGARRRLH